MEYTLLESLRIIYDTIATFYDTIATFYDASGPAAAPQFALKAVTKLQKETQSLTTSTQPALPRQVLREWNRLLLDVKTRLERPLDQELISVLDLLAALETLSRGPGQVLPPEEDFKVGNYPTLGGFVRGSVTAPTVTSNILDWAHAQTRQSYSQRLSLKRSLEQFSAFQANLRGRPLSELLDWRRGAVPDQDYSAYLRMLYCTLCSLRTIRCSSQFRANVALTQSRLLAADENSGVVFNTFFLHRHTVEDTYQWKEARISVSIPSELRQRSNSPSPSNQKLSPDQFCTIMRRTMLGSLKFDVSHNGLTYLVPEIEVERLDRIFLLQASSVSLATVLEKQKLREDVQLKTLLSYLLAKATWQFYTSQWIRGPWGKETVHFMRERRSGSSNDHEILTLIHNPFFATDLSATSSPPVSTVYNNNDDDDPSQLGATSDLPEPTHEYPIILALGVMLIEVELGEGIEKHRLKDVYDQNGDLMANADYFTAGTIICSDDWEARHTYQAIKEIIQICVKGKSGPLGKDRSSVRENLYKWVVVPLGNLFREAWSQDQEPEAYSPHFITFNTDEIQPPTHQSADPIKVGSVADLGSRAELIAPVVEMSLGKAQDGLLLSSEVSKITQKYRKETDRWFRNFQLLLSKHRLLRTPSQQRLKVAVLDTGVALDQFPANSEDRLRLVNFESFTGGETRQDLDGHGTQIASIILRLTKNCDLFIAKVAEDHESVQRERVSKALQHAREKWKVDAISLSLGFSKPTIPDFLGSEITKCLDAGIMVFASASNDGGEGSRTYPAKYQRVICVHSSNWRGERSGFNPGLEEQNDNFSTVGEHIRPTWDPSNPAEPMTTMAYKDGTSYATPVAVSIAAFMIAYIRKTMPHEQWRIKPWSPEGITIVFQIMKKDIDRYDWISPTWFMSEMNETLIQGLLIQKLCN